MRRRRAHRKTSRLSTFQAGALGILFIIVLSYGCYTKFGNPFASQFTIRATFTNAGGLVQNAPVRIAGVAVGKVTGVQPLTTTGAGGKQGAMVTMAIESDGLPIHSDATFAVRPRIFLEGNFFVDLHPGSPSKPDISSGHTFPIQAGTDPVQIDQVLTSLQLNTRQNLQTLIKEYGKAVYVGGPSYAASIKYWLPAYKYSGQVAHDFLGYRPHDLSTYIAQAGTVAGALDAHPQNLKGLITYLNTTAGALARQSSNLQAAIAELPRTLSVAIPTFNALNVAFPPLERLAVAFLPGVKSSGPAIDASLPFIDQLRQLVQPAELRGLASDLAGTVPSLARLTVATIPLMRNEVRPLASCTNNVVYPWSQLTLNDGVFSGTPGFPLRKVFQEGVDYLPGLAGESRVFDANGPYVRVLGTGGTLTYSLSPGLFGTALTKVDAVQPQIPANFARPPLHPNTPCETQAAITNLTAPPSGPIQAMHTNLSAPGAQARWTSVVAGALADIKQIVQPTGVKLNIPAGLLKELKLP